MTEITPENLNECGWYDISIPQPDLLVLIVSDPFKAMNLSAYLQWVHKVTGVINDDNSIRASITFKNALRISILTDKIERRYPSVKHLLDGEIRRVVAGMWESETQVRTIGHIQQLPFDPKKN